MLRRGQLLLLIVLLWGLAACGGQATPQAPPAGAATPTAEALEEPPAATDEAGPPAQVAGDPENGDALFHQMRPEVGYACATCHRVDSEEQLVGPGLLGIPQRAATRVEGQSAVEYLHNSIVNPGDYVVEGYPDNLMPRVYGELFSEEQINDLVAYLLTLEE